MKYPAMKYPVGFDLLKYYDLALNMPCVMNNLIDGCSLDSGNALGPKCRVSPSHIIMYIVVSYYHKENYIYINALCNVDNFTNEVG